MNKGLLTIAISAFFVAAIGVIGVNAMDNFHMHNAVMKSSSLNCGGNMKDCKDESDTSTQKDHNHHN